MARGAPEPSSKINSVVLRNPPASETLTTSSQGPWQLSVMRTPVALPLTPARDQRHDNAASFQADYYSKDRLISFAKEAREKAAQLQSCPEKYDLLKKARQADTAIHLNDWANSPGLQPPT